MRSMIVRVFFGRCRETSARLRRLTAACSLVALVLLTGVSAYAAEWAVTRGSAGDLPGSAVTVTKDGQLVARFVYGEKQSLPYLALYDDRGELITNAGMDASGAPVGLYPHHRGIFIGWQTIRSELGVDNLWVVGEGGTTMAVVEIEDLLATDASATIVARIEWRAATADASGSKLLLTETRRLTISRSSQDEVAQVDTVFRLVAARDLTLDGDVQHAGIHLRVSHEVAESPSLTSYLWAPDVTAGTGTVVSRDLKWGELLFPLRGRWYSALQLNAPTNPVEEFSIREYGRFGFFFKRELSRDEAIDLHYRFVVRTAESPAQAPKRSAAQIAQARAFAEGAHARFVRENR